MKFETFTANSPDFSQNFGFFHRFLNSFKLPSLIKMYIWYKKKFENVEVTPFESQQIIDFHFAMWSRDLSFWLFKVSVSGFLIWWPIAVLTPLYSSYPNLGVHTFLAWGVASWILVKLKPRWW